MSGIIPKWQMTEEDIKLNFITPALSPKWNGRMTMETQITDGKINLRGNLVSRAQPKRADYVLYINANNASAIAVEFFINIFICCKSHSNVLHREIRGQQNSF